MHNQHIILYYELRTEVYAGAAAFAAVSHLADWALECWWTLWARANTSAVIQATCERSEGSPRQ